MLCCLYCRIICSAVALCLKFVLFMSYNMGISGLVFCSFPLQYTMLYRFWEIWRRLSGHFKMIILRVHSWGQQMLRTVLIDQALLKIGTSAAQFVLLVHKLCNLFLFQPHESLSFFLLLLAFLPSWMGVGWDEVELTLSILNFFTIAVDFSLLLQKLPNTG